MPEDDASDGEEAPGEEDPDGEAPYEEAPEEDAPEEDAPEEDAPEGDAPEEDAPEEEVTSSLLPMDADDSGDPEREAGGDGGDGPGFDEETQERDGTPSEDDRTRDVPEREADDGRRGPPEGTVGACVLEALPDIVGNTHAASIVALVERGIAGGTSESTYSPDDGVTRGQMATFLARALDLEAHEVTELPVDVVEDHTHADAIAAVVQQGIAAGQSDGRFDPNAIVSRGQMATFLSRAFELAAEQGEAPADVVGSVHEQAVRAVTALGVAHGHGDGTFRPDGDVTRAQMASFLVRALDR